MVADEDGEVFLTDEAFLESLRYPDAERVKFEDERQAPRIDLDAQSANIVRALATSEFPTTQDWILCPFCQSEEKEPAKHDSGCLWRQAHEWVASKESPDGR